jgi:hypothetical protein
VSYPRRAHARPLLVTATEVTRVGLVESVNGPHTVMPGNYIVEFPDGMRLVLSSYEFEKLFEWEPDAKHSEVRYRWGEE